MGVARLHRLARRAVVDARHPPTSFDDRDGAAEGEMDDASANAGAARWDDEARRRKENAPADATADAETAETVDAIDTGAWPWWVDTLNRSLESYPAFVLLTPVTQAVQTGEVPATLPAIFAVYGAWAAGAGISVSTPMS